MGGSGAVVGADIERERERVSERVYNIPDKKGYCLPREFRGWGPGPVLVTFDEFRFFGVRMKRWNGNVEMVKGNADERQHRTFCSTAKSCV